MSVIDSFFSNHYFLAVLLFSGIALFNSQRDTKSGNKSGAVFWAILAFLFLGSNLTYVIFLKQWSSVAVGLIVLCIEVWLIRRSRCQAESAGGHR